MKEGNEEDVVAAVFGRHEGKTPIKVRLHFLWWSLHRNLLGPLDQLVQVSSPASMQKRRGHGPGHTAKKGILVTPTDPIIKLQGPIWGHAKKNAEIKHSPVIKIPPRNDPTAALQCRRRPSNLSNELPQLDGK